MNPDDERLELTELASAYLDGEATAEERARVEADPDLQALVEALRAARDAVAAVDAPAPAGRTAAIAAALDVFDRETSGAATGEHVAAATAPATPPTPLARRRWRWSHGLGAAAAALLVVAGGIALLRDDAEAPTTAEHADDTVQTEPADRAAPLDDADAGAPAAPAPADVLGESTTTAALAMQPPAAPSPDRAAAEAAAETSAATEGPRGEEGTAAGALRRLETAGEVAELAATLDPPGLTSAIADCEADPPAPDAVWIGTDGAVRQVVLVTLGDDRYAVIDLSRCIVIPASRGEPTEG